MSERQVGGTLKNKGETFMKKAERQKCWGARDSLWDCMRKNDENEKTIDKCSKMRKEYEDACPPTWVTHFDRKFHYENYKKVLYQDGFDAHDNKFTDESGKAKAGQ